MEKESLNDSIDHSAFDKVKKLKPRPDIPGWGIDLPKERRVGEPREGEFSPAENGAHWTEPTPQKQTVKIHVTPDRPGITPVFGSTYPPRGLSGLMRDYAYTLGEGKKRRWLTLLAADRVDVVESAIGDFTFGPRHDPEKPLVVRPIAAATFVAFGGAAAIGAFLFWNRKEKSAGRRTAKVWRPKFFSTAEMSRETIMRPKSRRMKEKHA